jgi:hemerythrin-like metal-binding protein
MDELINYAFTHFKREEQLMKEMEYPELDNHRKIHDLMTSEVIVMQKKIEHWFYSRLRRGSFFVSKEMAKHSYLARRQKVFSILTK